jgi:hypothetical protein
LLKVNLAFYGRKVGLATLKRVLEKSRAGYTEKSTGEK